MRHGQQGADQPRIALSCERLHANVGIVQVFDIPAEVSEFLVNALKSHFAERACMCGVGRWIRRKMDRVVVLMFGVDGGGGWKV